MYEYLVKKVTKVVDGDTIDVEIDLGFSISFSSRVRLAGIDTPESRTTNKEEKVLGLEVKKKLGDLINNAKSIVIRTEKMDSTEKYGRILGWLYLDGESLSVNEALVAGGYAWGYLGDTKVKDFEALKKKRAEAKKQPKLYKSLDSRYNKTTNVNDTRRNTNGRACGRDSKRRRGRSRECGASSYRPNLEDNKGKE